MRALLLLLAPTACALDNGAALTPPLGWQNWNGFGMRFNASLFRSMAAAMKRFNEEFGLHFVGTSDKARHTLYDADLVAHQHVALV